MEENQIHIPEGWKLTSFGEKELFRIIGSGIQYFNNEKEYYSTSSIDGSRFLFAEQLITYRNRPSRANMQPIENSVWFAKMKNTFKILKAQNKEIEEVILSTGFSGIESTEVDCDFLMQILSSEEFNSQKNLLAEGSTQEAVNNTKIKEIKFLLPECKQEQTQIATILSKVDEAITQTEQLIAKYTRIKTGLMQDLLTKGIDENGNIRSEETHEFKDSPLGRIPKEWEWSLIGDSCYVTKLAGYEFTKYMEYRDDGEVIALRALNIKNEKLILDDVQRISQKVSDFLVRSKLNKGDVLITYIGAYIGDIVQIQESNKYHLAPNIAKIVAGKKINPDFLENILRSERVQAYFKSLITTTANPSLTMGQIRKSYIIFPNEIDEQNRISLKIKTMKNSINSLSLDLNKYQSLKTGLMQDLLSGKVRVNHLIKETASV